MVKKQMFIHDFIELNAAIRPNQTAVICGEEQLTYGQLNEMANRLANAFLECGLQKGERVAVYLNNSTETVVSIFAALKASTPFVLINRTVKPRKLESILNDCQATVLLIDQRTSLQGTGERLLNDINSLNEIIVCNSATELSENHNPRFLNYNALQATFSPVKPKVQSIDLACLIYTSGTTGEPKGVMCNHCNVVFATQAIVQYLKNTELDIVLTVLPLAFSYGFYQLMAMFKVGGTLVLEESFASPSSVLQKIADHQVTGFAGVPTIYAILLGLDLTHWDLTSLRYLSNAAAEIPIDHVRQIREIFPKVDFYLMHGLTEVARTMYLPPNQVDFRPGSSGIPMEGTELWIEDEAGQRLEPGLIGELIVRGRHVMAGYWNDSQLTAQRFSEGNLPDDRICRTGDLFRKDEEGYYYFMSRKDDLIKSRGEKISLLEIEKVINSIHGVQESAVIGIPDPMMGLVPKAFVVAPDNDLTEANVIAYCKTSLEDFMIPKQVEFRNALPKTGSGKIRKVDLI